MKTALVGIVKKLRGITWSDLRRFGTNPVLKSSYFWLAVVPIAAKLLLQLKQPFVFALLGKEHTLYLHLPFSWSLFYFSAVAFAIASALFGLFCPRIIKQYSSFGEFYGESSGARELLNHLWTLGKKTRDDLMPILYTEAATIRGIANPQHPGNPPALAIEVQTMIRRVKREEMTDLFTTLREAHDRRFLKVRITIMISYSVGFVLIGIVALQNLIWVSQALLR